MAHARCLGHLLESRRPPVDVVPGLQPELANELALRPAIAFTKRMSGIQFAEKIGRAAGKHCGIEVNKVVLGRELFQGLPQCRLEEGGEPEEMAALGYVHRPKLS